MTGGPRTASRPAALELAIAHRAGAAVTDTTQPHGRSAPTATSRLSGHFRQLDYQDATKFLAHSFPRRSLTCTGAPPQYRRGVRRVGPRRPCSTSIRTFRVTPDSNASASWVCRGDSETTNAGDVGAPATMTRFAPVASSDPPGSPASPARLQGWRGFFCLPISGHLPQAALTRGSGRLAAAIGLGSPSPFLPSAGVAA